MGRRIGVLVNPSSGRGRVTRHSAEILRGLASRGDDVVAIEGGTAQEAQSLLAAAMAQGLDVVVAVGGDGTVHMALQAVVGTRTALGIVPLGTGNDAASSMGIPVDSPQAAVAAILTGRQRPFDVGLAETAEGSRRYFLCVLSTGFDSMVNERANRMSWPSGDSRYVVAMIAELRGFRPIPYRAVVDGVEIRDEAMVVSMGNGPSFGGGMRVCPNADMHDGQLSMLWIHRLSRLALVRVFPKVYSGRHLEHPAVTDRPVRVVELDAPGQVAYADGERIAALPVTVSAVADGVQVLVPR